MNDSGKPDYTNRAYDAMLPDLTLCRDVARGTSAVKAKGMAYLPSHPREELDDYSTRLARSLLFPMMGRSIKGLAGMVFREDIEWVDVPPAVEAHLENIDLQGNHADVFLKQVFADALEAGHAGILVDAPQRSEGVRTKRDETVLNLRPYWVHIKKEQLTSWRVIDVNGAQLLDQVVIKEPGVVPDGEFGEKEVVRYRIIRRGNPVTWETWISVENSEPVRELTGTINNVDEIPLAIVYADQTGILTSDPPMLDLAYTTLSHYQVQSDHLTALHKASVPILAITGVDTTGTVSVGPNTTFTLPEGATVQYVEHTGAALGSTRQQMLDLKADGAAQGLAMLQHETRQAETAEAKRIDKASQDSALAVAARGLQDGTEVALGFHAQMLGLGNKGGGSVVVSRDYETMSLDAQELAAYSALVANGQISLDTLWSILAETGSLPDDFDPELERANLEAEIMAMSPEPDEAEEEVADEEP